jgi:hypothetical protein
MAQQPPSGPRPHHCQGFTITLRDTTLCRTLLDEWSARRRDLYLKTHNTDQRYPCQGGIWTCNPSKRAAADLRLTDRAALRSAVWANCVILNLNRQYTQLRLRSNLNRWLYNYCMQFTVTDRFSVDFLYFRSAGFSAVCSICTQYAVCNCLHIAA